MVSVDLNDSVTILDSDQDDGCLDEDQLIFPVDHVDGAFLRFRMMWMLEHNEWFRYTVERKEVFLESWAVQRTVHTLVREFGVLRRVKILVKGENIPINLISTYADVEVMNMPMFLPTQLGPAFFVAEKDFNTFRDHVKEENDEGEIGVGIRLLFHTIVDRRHCKELTLADFAEWSVGEVKAALWSWEGQAPGHLWARFTPAEAGLREEDEEGHELEAERLLADIEMVLEEDLSWDRDLPSGSQEPVKLKTGVIPQTIGGSRTGSPELAPMPEIRHEAGEPAKRKRRRGNKRRRRGKKNRGNQEKWWTQPLVRDPNVEELTEEQELWCVKIMVQGLYPDASDDYINYNQSEYLKASKREKEDEGEAVKETKEEMKDEVKTEFRLTAAHSYSYGSGPGGWPMSPSDIDDIKQLEVKKEENKLVDGVERGEADNTISSVVSRATRSTVISPGGELSWMGNGSGEGSSGAVYSGSSGSGSQAPRRKRVRLSVSSEMSGMPSLSESPFLAKDLKTSRVITISSSSSEGADTGTRRLTLSDIIKEKMLFFVDDMTSTTKYVEVFEDDDEEKVKEIAREGAKGGEEEEGGE